MIERPFFPFIIARLLSRLFYLFVSNKNSNISLTLRDGWLQRGHMAMRTEGF